MHLSRICRNGGIRAYVGYLLRDHILGFLLPNSKVNFDGTALVV